MSGLPTPVLHLHRAAFGYQGRAVVTDVDLTVERGQVVALLGPNGSGKTTLVKGLIGLSEHLSGDVTILGTPLARLRDRTRVGYVPQRHTLTGGVRDGEASRSLREAPTGARSAPTGS